MVLLLLAPSAPCAAGVAHCRWLSGVVAGVVPVSLAAGKVHGLTMGFGTTLIGEAVDYGIYYLVQARGALAMPAGCANNGRRCAWAVDLGGRFRGADRSRASRAWRNWASSPWRAWWRPH
jgi:predicted exporter